MPHRRGPSTLYASLIALVALIGGLMAPATASHTSTSDCPDYLRPEEIREGLKGTGYTVADGRTRISFAAEVLGVLEDALGPGRDMIVIEASGGPIDDHGVWAGMSGSPIYVGDRLLGAVAFGLAFGPENIVGVTPASEMFRVMEYPDASSSTSTERARMPRYMRRQVALAAGVRTRQVPGALSQLPMPVSVSGLSRAGLQRFGEIVERENLPLIPYAGSAAPSQAAATDGRLRPGDNLGVAASYGDITFAGVGTVTFVCAGHAMAFGHPFMWEGATTLGANQASTIAVLDDNFVPFEIASLDDRIGVVDQDRFAGVRQTFGLEPAGIPISSAIHALNTDRARDGLTEVMLSEMMPFLGYYHLSSNLMMTMDQYSEGSADLTWTITGTDASGEPWSLERSNLYSSEWGIPDEATFELSNALNSIAYNRFEDVTFTGVDIDGTATKEIEQYSIGAVLVSRDGINYRDREQIKARAGDTIYLRLELQPYSGEPITVDMSVDLPRRIKSDATLDIMGGGETFGEEEICLYDPTQCTGANGKRIESFQDLLDSLRDKPRNHEIVATLRGGFGGRIKGRSLHALDQVVKGQGFVYVRIAGGRKGGGGGVAEPEPLPPEH